MGPGGRDLRASVVNPSQSVRLDRAGRGDHHGARGVCRRGTRLAMVWTIDCIRIHHGATEAAARVSATAGGMGRLASRAVRSRRMGCLLRRTSAGLDAICVHLRSFAVFLPGPADGCLAPKG